MNQPHRVLVFDLFVRAFHWLLAATVFAALGIALLADDDGAVFPRHMVLGLVAGGMVLLRVVWGLVGSRYARFSSFLFGPAAVVRYLRAALSRGLTARYPGHNPGSSVAIFAILLLVLGLGATGLLRTQGHEAAEEVHEVLAYTLIGVVTVHVLGVVWHWLRHRENLVRSMIDGRRVGVPEEAIASSHPVAAMAFAVLSLAWAGSLAAGCDAQARKLTFPLLGKTIPLGEPEEQEGHEERERQEHD